MTRSRLVQWLVVVLCILGVAVLYFVRFSPSARLARHLHRGERLYRAGEYDPARLEFINVVRRDPKHLVALERLGSIALFQGIPVQALPYLVRIRDLAPDDLPNQARLIGALVKLGEFKPAWTDASKLVKESRGDASIWVSLADSTATREQASFVTEALKNVPERHAGHHYAAGVMSLLNQDHAAAHVHLQHALTSDPKLARAHLRIADVFLSKGERERAGESIKNGSTTAPLRSLERLRYAELLADQGKLEEARAWATEITSNAPDYLPAWVFQSRLALEEKNTELALSSLQSVLSRDPANHEGRLIEARVQLQKKNPSGAIEILERLTRTYPRATLPMYELGRAYVMVNRMGDARTELRRALEIQPGLIEPQLLLAELNLRSGEAHSVVSDLQALLARRPKFAPAQSLLADAYRILKRPADAAAVYREMAQAAPKATQPLAALGAVLRDQGDLEQARATFEKVLALDPNHLTAIGHLCELDSSKKDFASALARLDRLEPGTRDSAGANLIRARIHLAAQDFSKAEHAFLQAIQANPDSALAYQFLVQLYLQQKRTAEATARLVEKVTRTPGDVGSRTLLAVLYDSAKEYEKARATYEEVLKQQPENSSVLNNLAYLLAEHLGDSEKAESFARKSRSLQSTEPAVADTLGWVLYRRGDFEAALALLQESSSQFALRGDVPAEASYHLGMASAAMGVMDVARNAFSKAMESPTDFGAKSSIPFRVRLIDFFSSPSTIATDGVTSNDLKQRVEKEPSDPFLHLCLGKSSESAGQHPEAILAYSRALEINPKLATAAASLARIYAFHLPDRPKSDEFAQRARTLAPSDSKIAATLGLVASHFGDLPRAHGLLLQASTDANVTADLLFLLGDVAFRMGKRKDASAVLERATKRPDASPQLVSAIQEYRKILQFCESAPTDANEAEVAGTLARDPKHLPARMVMGLRYEAKEDWNAAAGIYEQILREVPTFPLAQARLALVNLEAGKDPKQAHELASTAYKASSDEPLTITALAEVSYRQKEFQRTADLLTQASRLTTLNASQLYLLGSSYFQAGNKSKSQEPLKQALQAGLKPEQSQEAEKMLKASSL